MVGPFSFPDIGGTLNITIIYYLLFTSVRYVECRVVSAELLLSEKARAPELQSLSLLNLGFLTRRQSSKLNQSLMLSKKCPQHLSDINFFETITRVEGALHPSGFC